MGGTNTDMGLVTENGNIVQRRNIPTNAYTELEPYVHDMMREIDSMVAEQSGIALRKKNTNTAMYLWCSATTPTLPPMASMCTAVHAA